MKRCLALALLMLSSCDDMPRARSESDIEAIATDAATDATSSKFSDMEARIDSLETEVGDLKEEAAGRKAYAEKLAQIIDEESAEVDALVSKHNNLVDGYRAHTHPQR